MTRKKNRKNLKNKIMLEVIEGDIFKEKSGIIVHGVNCRGKMGTGIALMIRKLYPQVYIDYTEHWGKYFREPARLLGDVVYTQVNKNLIIASAFTQLNYSKYDVRSVSYDAIAVAFKNISDTAKENRMVIKYPTIGAGYGGGDWRIISNIIDCVVDDKVQRILFKF